MGKHSEIMDLLISLIMVVISQSICISKNHFIHFKFMQFYLIIISIKLRDKKLLDKAEHAIPRAAKFQLSSTSAAEDLLPKFHREASQGYIFSHRLKCLGALG